MHSGIRSLIIALVVCSSMIYSMENNDGAQTIVVQTIPQAVVHSTTAKSLSLLSHFAQQHDSYLHTAERAIMHTSAVGVSLWSIHINAHHTFKHKSRLSGITTAVSCGILLKSSYSLRTIYHEPLIVQVRSKLNSH